MDHKSIECVTCHHSVSSSEKRERWDPLPPNHPCHETYRTGPFFIWPSVNTLSLDAGDEWQWSIATTNSDRGKTFSYRSRCGGVYGRYRQDRMWSERRGCDAHFCYSLRSQWGEMWRPLCPHFIILYVTDHFLGLTHMVTQYHCMLAKLEKQRNQ